MTPADDLLLALSHSYPNLHAIVVGRMPYSQTSATREAAQEEACSLLRDALDARVDRPVYAGTDLDKLEALLTGPLPDDAEAVLLAAAPELIAAARMLEELIACLPQCECGQPSAYQGDDGALARVWCHGCIPQQFIGGGDGGFAAALPWADIIRRRDAR